MSRNSKNEGGGIDGVNPDAEIERLSREHEGQERQRQTDQARRDQQERDRKGR